MQSSTLYVLVAALVIVGQHAAQGQNEVVFQTISLSASRGPSDVFAQLSINGVPSFFINRPTTTQLDIPEGSSIFYNGNSLAITGADPIVLTASRFQYLYQDPGSFRFRDVTGPIPGAGGQPGPGTLYYDGDTALFTNSDLFIGTYEGLAAQFPVPPSQVTISTPRVNNELALNLQSSPSDPVTDGNVIELTGSDAFILGSGESLTYVSNSLRYRRGSVTQRVFNPITNFYVLEDITENGQQGRTLRRFTGGSSEVITGPGILRVGTSPNDGSRVAFFSPSTSVNQEINSGIIDGQLSFDAVQNSAQISDIFTNPGTPARLIDLGGTSKTFTYPTASRVTFDDTSGRREIRVFDRFNQQLGAFFDSDLSSFLNHQVQTTSSGTASFDIPDGGVTLISNSNDGQIFIYPSRNTLLTGRINEARSSITIPPNPSPTFSISSSGGSSVLSINGDETVTISDRPPIIVNSGQSCNYNGASVTVYNNGAPGTPVSGTPITVNSLTTFVTPGNCLNTFTNTAPRDLPGPGVAYSDNQNRAFFTNEVQVINRINGFLNSRPHVRITTTTRTEGGRRFVDIVNPEGIRLVEGSTSTTTNVGSRQGLIYTGNTVRSVNGFSVPSSFTIRYVVSTTPGVDDTVEVINPDGDVYFTTTASSSFRYRQGGVLQPTPTTTTSYSGGGVFYFNPNTGNVVYNDDTTTSTGLVTDLTTSGIVFDTNTRNITTLNFFDGRTTTRYDGSSTSFLSGPGTIFTSGNEGFYSTDSTTTTRVVTEITNNIPVVVRVNQTTGGVTIFNPGTQTTIFNFTTGSERTTVSTGTTITYTNGVLLLPGRNITTDSFTYFNGISTQVFTSGDTVTFSGPGQVIVNEQTTETIFIDNQNTNNRINNVVNNVPVVPPVLVRPTTTSFISKVADVFPLFGQRVTVYQSANVNLRCVILQSVPTSSFMFFRDGVALDGSEIGSTITMVSENEQILTVNTFNVSAAGRYECRVSNGPGRDNLFADIFIRPPVAPMIQNNFFPSIPELPGLTVTARDIQPQNPVMIIIRDRTPGQTLEPNPLLLTNTVNIACKDDVGLPRPTIVWTATDSNGAEVPINMSNIFVPRAGRSIYTINTDNTDPDNTLSITYECTASNEAGEATGLVTITPRSYVCEGNVFGPCSVTCGFGIQSSAPINCQVRTNENIASIDAADLPQGLYPTQLQICQSSVMPFCPAITYEFNTTAFGACSRTCGGGVQERNITCFRLIGGVRDMAVDDIDCIVFGLKRPAAAQECFPQKCPRWMILSAYSPCSSTCAGGVRSRNVSCVQFIAQINATTGEFVCDADGNPIGESIVLSDASCFAGNMPRRVDACNTQIPCPRRWSPGTFAPCDANFCQERSLTCTGFDPSDPEEQWLLDVSECANLPLLHTVRSCGGGTCDAGIWMTENLGTCTVTCGIGNQERNVFCVSRADGSRINEGFCNINERPPVFETCILFNCPGRCDFEPPDCRVFRLLRRCKDLAVGMPCCKSCPLQFVDNTPTLITRDNLVLSLDQNRYNVAAGTDLRICCVASSSTPNAFLPFLFNCNFFAEEIEREVMVGKVLDNTACVTFPTSGLASGSGFLLSLEDDQGMVRDIANVTIV
ncbi:uncharacterized protein LOC135338831 [Halichondria panicea]|uniref:uncharacterized protein LOC135338831 n=1 Tax=Halichondria panicea TaxID=6063 RepID=UPI00312B9A37